MVRAVIVSRKYVLGQQRKSPSNERQTEFVSPELTSVHCARLLLLLSGKFHISSFPLRLLLSHVRSNFMLNGFRNRNQHGLCSRLKTKYELLWIPSNIAYAGWTCWCSSESQRFRSTAYSRPNREYNRFVLFAWIGEHLIVWILSVVSM